MPNEFEERVKQKLDELRLVPGEPVWKVIEEQIREKKDRIPVFLWLVLLLLLTGGGIWVFNSGTHEKAISRKNASTNQDRSLHRPASEHVTASGKAKEKTTVYRKDVVAGRTRHITDVTAATRTAPAGAAPTASIPKRVNNDRAVGTTLINNISKKQQHTSLFKHIAPAYIDKNDHPGQGQQGHAEGKQLHNIQIDRLQPALMIAFNSRHNILPDIRAVDAGPVFIVSEPTPPAIVNLHHAGALKFGLIAGIGISDVQSGAGLSGFSAGDKALNNAAGGSSQNYPTPAPIQEGLSFRFGLFGEKTLGRHWSLTAGLEYSYFSTSTTVGQRIHDTLLFSLSQPRYNAAYAGYSTNPGTSGNVSGGNAGGPGQHYSNKYEFIGVPVVLGYRIGRLPLRIYGGLTLQYLLHSTALQYDATSNIYYFDRTAFNRWQWSAAIGLKYPLLHPGRLSLDLGPELMIGSSLQKASYPASHLFAIGLTARMLKEKGRH